MKALTKVIFTLLLVSLIMPSVFAASPVGTWSIMNDAGTKKRALIKLSLSGDTLNGTIVKIFPQAGDTGICQHCPDNFKDKPVVGMRVLWGLKKGESSEWIDGRIIDPQTGKIYRVKLNAEENKLFVRGYIGVSLLGRTQTWVR